MSTKRVESDRTLHKETSGFLQYGKTRWLLRALSAHNDSAQGRPEAYWIIGKQAGHLHMEKQSDCSEPKCPSKKRKTLTQNALRSKQYGGKCQPIHGRWLEPRRTQIPILRALCVITYVERTVNKYTGDGWALEKLKIMNCKRSVL